MNLDQAKKAFVDTWARLGSAWGINRSMASIHALLLASPDPLTTDEIMDRLSLSRGNANSNLRALMDWGLVYKEFRPGMRKELFRAEKEAWVIARQIAKERRRKEIEPLLDSLARLREPESSPRSTPAELDEFKTLIEGFLELGERGVRVIDLVLKLEQRAFFRPFLKLLTK